MIHPELVILRQRQRMWEDRHAAAQARLIRLSRQQERRDRTRQVRGAALRWQFCLCLFWTGRTFPVKGGAAACCLSR
jgi:hypothetical protein